MQQLKQAINALPDNDGQTIAVALSGGADSTALLYAATQRWNKQVIVFHIRHGLQPKDPEFASHCQLLCEQLKIPLYTLAVNAQHKPRQSPEDAARNARYIALSQLAKQHHCHCILLAHHADDQVETILLALTRGAGLAGLAAMPKQFIRYQSLFIRPFLNISGEHIRQVLNEHKISYIEDPTNQDIKYTRNKIRLQLLPILKQYFPQYQNAFIRTARLAAQGHSLVEELACLDLQQMNGEINIKTIQQLSTHRQANLLRYWLKLNWGAIGSEAQVNELLHQIKNCRTRGHKIDLKIANGKIKRNKELLIYLP